MKTDTAPVLEISVASAPSLDHIIRGLLYVYVFSLPFEQLLFVERNGFIMLLGLLGIWCVVNRRHFFSHTPLNLPLLLFIGWVGFTIPFAAFPDYSFKEFAKLLQQGVLFFIVAYFFKEDPHRRRLIHVMVAGVFIVASYGIYQFTEMIGIFEAPRRLALLESVTPGEVWLSTYFILMIPLCFALSLVEHQRLRKLAYGCVTGLATIVLLLTFSRAGLLAVWCELWVFAWWMKRKPLLIAACVVTVLIVGAAAGFYQKNFTTLPGTNLPVRGVSSSSFVHRLDIWKFTVPKIWEHPIVGIGYGKENFRMVFGSLSEEVQPGHVSVVNAGTHNIFLDLALGVGLPGLGLFLWLIQRIVWTVRNELSRAKDTITQVVALAVSVSVIGMVVRLSFDQMLVGTLAIQFWVLIGMAIRGSEIEEGEPSLLSIQRTW